MLRRPRSNLAMRRDSVATSYPQGGTRQLPRQSRLNSLRVSNTSTRDSDTRYPQQQPVQIQPQPVEPTLEPEVLEAQATASELTEVTPEDFENCNIRPCPVHMQQLDLLTCEFNRLLEVVGCSVLEVPNVEEFVKSNSTNWKDWSSTVSFLSTAVISMHGNLDARDVRVATKAVQELLDAPVFISEHKDVGLEELLIGFFEKLHNCALESENYQYWLEQARLLEPAKEDSEEAEVTYNQCIQGIKDILEVTCGEISPQLAGYLSVPPVASYRSIHPTSPVWRIQPKFDTREYNEYLALAVRLAAALARHYTCCRVVSGRFKEGRNAFVVVTDAPVKWRLSRGATFLDLAVFLVPKLDGVPIEILADSTNEHLEDFVEFDCPDDPPSAEVSELVEEFTEEFDKLGKDPKTDSSGNIYRLRYLVSEYMHQLFE